MEWRKGVNLLFFFRRHWIILRRCSTIRCLIEVMREEEAWEVVQCDLDRWRKDTILHLTIIYHHLHRTRGEEPIRILHCTKAPTRPANHPHPCLTVEVAMHVSFHFFFNHYNQHWCRHVHFHLRLSRLTVMEENFTEIT